MHQIRFRLGLCPRPQWGAYSAAPAPLAGFRVPTSKGKGEGKGDGKGREGKGVRGRRNRVGKGGEGKGREGSTATSFFTL